MDHHVPEAKIMVVSTEEEKNSSPMKDGGDLSKDLKTNTNKKKRLTREKRRNFFMTPEEYQSVWNKIFLVSYVIAVIIDPLFFYIPVIHADKKCLGMDQKLKIVVLVLRLFTDIIYMLHIVFQVRALKKLEKDGSATPKRSKSGRKFIIIGLLAILPVPQVLILVLFSKMWCSRYWTIMKFLNFFVLIQYVPRILRIYQSCKEIRKGCDSLAERVWVKGAFNLFLYITASHILGAFWYYFSIQRETTCWQNACENRKGCDPNDFSCYGNTSRNLTFLKDFCPVNPPNATVFDFGIFIDALESDWLRTTDFPKKYLQCFWWGLRNLSSFGQNLKTSSDVWETCFAALISILGLLLFLYLIGNLQTYMQLATTASHERRQKVKIKEPEIDSWIARNCIDESHYRKHMKQAIVQQLRSSVKQEKDFDLEYLLLLLEGLLEKGRDPVDKKEIEKIIADFTDHISKGKKQQRDMKAASARSWIKANGIPQPRKTWKKLKQYVLYKLGDDVQDVNVVNLLSVLPDEQRTFIKKHLCSTMLEQVILFLRDVKEPQEQAKKKEKLGKRDDKLEEPVNIDDKQEEADANRDNKQEEPEKYINEEDKLVLKQFLEHLKPVVYKEDSYIIRKGEPLDFMLFITQGVVWSFGSSNSSKIDRFANQIEKVLNLKGEGDQGSFGEGNRSSSSSSTTTTTTTSTSSTSSGKVEIEHLGRNEYYGQELLEWILDETNHAIPISKKNLKSHTEVEGFVLKAIDLQKILPNNKPKPLQKPGTDSHHKFLSSNQSGLERFARYAAKKALYRLKKKEKGMPAPNEEEEEEEGGGHDWQPHL